jgi:hypothetical protein
MREMPQLRAVLSEQARVFQSEGCAHARLMAAGEQHGSTVPEESEFFTHIHTLPALHAGYQPRSRAYRGIVGRSGTGVLLIDRGNKLQRGGARQLPGTAPALCRDPRWRLLARRAARAAMQPAGRPARPAAESVEQADQALPRGRPGAVASKPAPHPERTPPALEREHCARHSSQRFAVARTRRLRGRDQAGPPDKSPNPRTGARRRLLSAASKQIHPLR